MSKPRPVPQEVASESIENQLVQIRERLGAIESVQGLVHQDQIEARLGEIVNGSKQRANILRNCHDTPTKAELMERCGFRSLKALDYHLDPLREDEMILHTKQNGDGVLCFGWSFMLQRLQPDRRRKILGD